MVGKVETNVTRCERMRTLYNDMDRMNRSPSEQLDDAIDCGETGPVVSFPERVMMPT